MFTSETTIMAEDNSLSINKVRIYNSVLCNFDKESIWLPFIYLYKCNLHVNYLDCTLHKKYQVQVLYTKIEQHRHHLSDWSLRISWKSKRFKALSNTYYNWIWILKSFPCSNFGYFRTLYRLVCYSGLVEKLWPLVKVACKLVQWTC